MNKTTEQTLTAPENTLLHDLTLGPVHDAAGLLDMSSGQLAAIQDWRVAYGPHPHRRRGGSLNLAHLIEAASAL